MTREYRHGDPMRRVHWPATARHGALMVRQEESVTTPEATVILDHRFVAHSSGYGSVFGSPADDGSDLVTSDTFEWAVTAAMSVGAHLAELNYSLRFLDAAGEPAFQRSSSAPEPDNDLYSGAAGIQSIAESLAAIQLTGPHHARREHDTGRREHAGSADAAQSVFDDRLMDKLAAHRMRGPVLAAPREDFARGGPGPRTRGRLCRQRVCGADHGQTRGVPRPARGPAFWRLARCCRRGVHVAAGRLDVFRRRRRRPVDGCGGRPPRGGGGAMTLTSQPQAGTGVQPQPVPGSPGSGRFGAGAFPWVMSGAVAVSVCGASLSLNGVLRGWAWFLPVLTTVVVVSLTMALLRTFRAQPLLVAAGGLASLALILTFTFFRRDSIAGFLPSQATFDALGRHLRRASETVLAESSPVAPNAGIVLVACAALGLVVILVDALALPLGMPATSGLGLLAVLVVPAMIKPQSVGWLGFVTTAAGYLVILACSQWFAPDARTQADTARNPGQVRRAALTGGVALVVTLLLQLVVPGFDQGTFPQGSRLNPWGTATGLNPMISLGNSLRTPTGEGRITYATNSTTPLYLRSVTVDRFDGESWSPDDRNANRRAGTGRMDAGHEILAPEQTRQVTVVNTGDFTSPYLPVPYAPESVNGLTGRWSWDPATLSIKGTDTNSRDQQYLVQSSVPKLTTELLDASSAPVQGVPEEFIRPPSNVPDIVRTTAESVTADSRTAYAKAMAIQRFLRGPGFTYSLESPVQNGYDGNGLSVLADFLTQKSGYCIHFASAMAVMARLEGIPSRIAVGYAPGRQTGATVSVAGQGALPEYEVDARDAHAWPELYFQGLGWVPFEPTPSRGVVPAYAQDSSASGGSQHQRTKQ